MLEPMLTAVLFSRPKWFGLQIQVQHVLLNLLYVGIGAFLGYFKAEPTLDLITALSSWATAKPLLIGAAMAFLAAVIAQAQQSLFGPTAIPPATKKTIPFPGDSTPEVPPAAQRRRLGFVPALAFAPLVFALGMGCIPNIASQIQDGVTLEQCVQQNWGKPFTQVVLDCLPGEEQIVADVIADISVFLSSQNDGGAPVATAYTNEPLVVAAIPKAIERAKAKR
jgi:hypothetical protein